MINTNYKIEYLTLLLDEGCILQRYYPLIPSKHDLLQFLQTQGVCRKDDCFAVSDDKYLADSTLNAQTLRLFKQFLTMYDVKRSKLVGLDKLDLSAEQRQAFAELYLLPGVSQTRAELYYKAEIRSLQDVAKLSASQLIAKCQCAIDSQKLLCVAPLPKEASTHIAVAKAFCDVM